MLTDSHPRHVHNQPGIAVMAESSPLPFPDLSLELVGGEVGEARWRGEERRGPLEHEGSGPGGCQRRDGGRAQWLGRRPGRLAKHSPPQSTSWSYQLDLRNTSRSQLLLSPPSQRSDPDPRISHRDFCKGLLLVSGFCSRILQLILHTG